MITAISIGIFERLWNKRKQMRETVVRGIRKHNLIPHLHFYHPHDGPHLHVAAPTCKLRDYDPAYLTMLQDHARQVQSFVGVQERYVSPKKPGLVPRLQMRRRSVGPKRASWSSFSGLSKRKMRSTKRIPLISNAENIRVFPFRN